jgi:hypothetical protein
MQRHVRIVTRQTSARRYKDDLWPLSLTLAIAKMLLTKNGEHSWEEDSPERIAVIDEMVSASCIHQDMQGLIMEG